MPAAANLNSSAFAFPTAPHFWHSRVDDSAVPYSASCRQNVGWAPDRLISAIPRNRVLRALRLRPPHAFATPAHWVARPRAARCAFEAQFGARFSTAMVYQKGCGNRLLRGTGRPRGNLCPRGARFRGNLGGKILSKENGRKTRGKMERRKRGRVGGKMMDRKSKKKTERRKSKESRAGVLR
jgi:hypothetical protein